MNIPKNVSTTLQAVKSAVTTVTAAVAQYDQEKVAKSVVTLQEAVEALNEAVDQPSNP